MLDGTGQAWRDSWQQPHISCPPLHLPATGSPQVLGCRQAFPSHSKQHFLTCCTSTPTAPSYQILPFYAQNNPQAEADWVLRCG